MNVKYFDRGDYILEITEHSLTERTKRKLPKPHTKGRGGITAPVVPKPQRAPEPRRIVPKRKGGKKSPVERSRCAYLGERVIGRGGEPESLKVLCVTCQGANNIDQPVYLCHAPAHAKAAYTNRRGEEVPARPGNCLPHFRPTGEAADRWYGNKSLSIEPRLESTMYHVCDGCPSRRVMVELTAPSS
jgi:hypothetical protein